jgi:CBS domain-containing protein
MANPSSPQLNKRTTLKDALSLMLDADVQTGIVVDRTGAVQGLLSIDTIADKMREGEHAAEFAQVGVAPEELESVEPDPEAVDPAAPEPRA